MIRLVLALALLILSLTNGDNMASDACIVYFGTYTSSGKSKGIYTGWLDTSTGRLSTPELAAEIARPSFLAIHPDRRHLYAVSEYAVSGGGKAGALSAFSINQVTGKLTLLNRQSSGGLGPCHVNVDRTGRCVLVANYHSGSCAALPVRDDGALSEIGSFIQHQGSGVNPDRQAAPHAHSINLAPDNRFAFVADLGLDKILIYKLNPRGAVLAPNNPPFAQVPPGSGPRHMAFRPDGRFAYVINEMLCTVTVFSYESGRGALREIQTVSTLPEGEKFQPAYSAAEVQVHPCGKFLYGSNRGHDTIAVFAIDPANGTLRLIKHESTQGRTPRAFGLDPTGAWLLAANQDTDNVVVFSVNPATGHLKPTGQSVEVGMPVCVKFMGAKEN